TSDSNSSTSPGSWASNLRRPPPGPRVRCAGSGDSSSSRIPLVIVTRDRPQAWLMSVTPPYPTWAASEAATILLARSFRCGHIRLSFSLSSSTKTMLESKIRQSWQLVKVIYLHALSPRSAYGHPQVLVEICVENGLLPALLK